MHVIFRFDVRKYKRFVVFARNRVLLTLACFVRFGLKPMIEMTHSAATPKKVACYKSGQIDPKKLTSFGRHGIDYHHIGINHVTPISGARSTSYVRDVIYVRPYPPFVMYVEP